MLDQPVLSPGRLFTLISGSFALVFGLAAGEAAPPGPGSGSAEKPGVFSDPGFFPLAVWLQNPANAARYREAGINTYVALWKGPTEEQVAALKKAGMKLICRPNAAGLRYRNDPMVIAWMHDDEPDNAQSLGEGKGYGPPVKAEKIVEEYRNWRKEDPTRPVLLNLGQGVAWDRWYGRGVRTNHPEDYPEYMKGGDIVSFDIYPVVHDSPEVAGRLWLVAYGVDRLVQWGAGQRTIWNCLECTRIGNPDRKPTPQQVRCEAWMSIIHGSRGLIYFVHQFKPTFREAALLDDPEMLAAVTDLNRQITALAPLLHSTAAAPAVGVKSSNAAVPVDTMVKRGPAGTCLFAVGMREGRTTATFTFEGPDGGVTTDGEVEVLGENRRLPVRRGVFSDTFESWDVHIYRAPLVSPR